MILVVDAINKHKFHDVLEEMFRLRARVFGERLGWEVNIVDGMERDQFDDLDPAYAIGLDDDGNVVSCVRALQTTGPHMLSDVFADILDGEPPIRDPHMWESTRFCVDTKRLGRGNGRGSVNHATCELMIASLESAMNAGVSDIVTVIDPVMNRVLKRSGNAPYDYVGKTVPMGKVPAMAALLDATDERVSAIRTFSGIESDVFLTDEEGRALFDKSRTPQTEVASDTVSTLPERAANDNHGTFNALTSYCRDQLNAARTHEERAAARALVRSITETVSEKDRVRLETALRHMAD
ncbi:N-acyl-L-homoserine lactone synthetase [Roseivivax sediminis]|uniref:Acyl-homoserine-lactone synthase n=2 Tax=Roseivivax sediminis TaxID=936889 RepID=A0A1I1Y541_9RHOB|nr:N-acyl-L-homoserine lactone synthetase [Roseivivax sediminis]